MEKNGLKGGIICEPLAAVQLNDGTLVGGDFEDVVKMYQGLEK